MCGLGRRRRTAGTAAGEGLACALLLSASTRWTWLAGTLRVYAPAVTDIPLEDRVDGAFTPNDRDNTHLAALDIKSAAFDIAKAVSSQLRRLLDRTTDFG